MWVPLSCTLSRRDRKQCAAGDAPCDKRESAHYTLCVAAQSVVIYSQLARPTPHGALSTSFHVGVTRLTTSACGD